MEEQVTQQRDFVTPSQVPQEGTYYENPEGPRFNNPAEYEQAMAAQTPQPQQPGVQFNVPDFAAMRQAALQQAIEQVQGQKKELSMDGSQYVPQKQPDNAPRYETAPPARPPQPIPPNPPRPAAQEEPQVVYVRRNLTLAELILVFVISIGAVTGVQFGWHIATDVLPRIEIRDK
jgi:hypothetical protein